MRKNISGMTLVETIVSVALLAIASMIIFTGFLAATNFMQTGDKIKNEGEQAYSAAEGDLAGTTEVSRKPADFAFTLDGIHFNVAGDYIEAKDANGNQKFTRFAPK